MILEARTSVLVAQKMDDSKPEPIDPPPYADLVHQSSFDSRPTSQRPSLRAGHSHGSSSPSQHTGNVNGLFLEKRKEPITGSFRLDPCLPTSDTHRPPKGCPDIPNAYFQTHSGVINVELATACAHNEHSRAVARVASRTGDMTVLLAESSATQTIKLDMTSRRGTVALFVPRNFCGVIRLHTKRGALEVMPALAKLAKIVNETEEEILLMVGNSQAPPSSGKSTASTADYCQLYSRFGKLYVGVRGEDKLLPREPGVWQKFASYFGRHDDASTRTLSTAGSAP